MLLKVKEVIAKVMVETATEVDKVDMETKVVTAEEGATVEPVPVAAMEVETVAVTKAMVEEMEEETVEEIDPNTLTKTLKQYSWVV